MMKFFLSLFVCLNVSLFAQFGNPDFKINPELQKNGNEVELNIEMIAPADHHIYEESLEVAVKDSASAVLTLIEGTKAKRKYDEAFGKEVGILSGKMHFRYRLTGIKTDDSVKIEIGYQACNETTCFMPVTKAFALTFNESIQLKKNEEKRELSANKDMDSLDQFFEVTARGTGYRNAKDFMSFLKGKEEKDSILRRVLGKYGLLAVMLLVIPFGFLLNLTPCVLPMIPINLAIIGAGARAGSKKRGFLLGATYGAGMALVYGLLGIIVVLTSSRFGALNDSPWFNLAMTLLFAVMALAMLGLFEIDFSRFGGGSGQAGGSSKGPFLAALLLGGTAALLAGACVAPVLITVLLLATELYKSNPAALLLPLMLGVGMALPWPIAGAGLSFLPKPGGWMTKVKYGFGILIALASIYYGQLTIRQFSRSEVKAVASEDGWKTSLKEGMEEGIREKKPVLVDFWSLSCKACYKMKKTTFVDEEVKKRMDDFVLVAVQTDLNDDSEASWAKSRFKIIGQPTYLILTPKEK